MDPKDFKFDDNAFDDVFSTPDSDEFEDVYSDKEDLGKSKAFESEFEDIFSGKRDFEFCEENQRSYTDEYYRDNDNGEFEPVRRVVNSEPEKRPYSYNYGKASQNKAKKVSQQREFDIIDEDISSGKQPKEKKKKKKVSAGKVLAVLLVLIIVFAAAVGVGGYSYAKSMTEKVNYKPLESNQYISSAELLSKDGVKNILLVGVDARAGESNNETRSDTMMLLTIDNNNSQIKLSSFLRDTYIDIPNYKWAKLNAAQSHGGTQLLVDTLEYNYKIDIDNYMLVNFDMFITIIDSLDGIEVAVTEKEAKYINSKDHMTPTEAAAFPEEISSGESVHLTGAQALWYSRIRYLDSDFMRTQRQRKVISAVIAKAKRTSPVTLIKTVNEIVPMVETDLKSEDMMNIGMGVFNYIKYDIVQQQVPAEGTWSSGTRNGGQSVLLIDLDKNRDILKSFIFDKAEVKDKAQSEEKTNSN